MRLSWLGVAIFCHVERFVSLLLDKRQSLLPFVVVGDMYLNGLLPIDRMRQPGPAVEYADLFLFF
jgi:hypothetical protein